MKKLAIIGASYLQAPLIRKAKEMGLETHVFAWETGDVGESLADHFYPISIVEKDAITEKCRELAVDGICTIATDLGAVTVNYVAHQLGLTCNSPEATKRSTNKHLMRQAFEAGGDPSPKSFLVDLNSDLEALPLSFPVIVKPTDRSGSRGICRLECPEGLRAAVRSAMDQSFEKKALVEEYLDGQEYSVECISFRGEHHFLTMTKKYTTGDPHYIETGHLEPAGVDPATLERVRGIVFHALDSLGLENGASHTELKIDANGRIGLIEIGGRMGGDMIGSALVHLSTGIDFTRGVIQVALGHAPDLTKSHPDRAAAVRFVFSAADLEVLERIKRENPEYLVDEDVGEITEDEVTDSSTRFGYFLFAADSARELTPYLEY